MKDLLKKLNFKDQKRIVILNAEEAFIQSVSEELNGVIIDKAVDQRCPYEFMLVFVKKAVEVEEIAPVVLHNLTADGIIWFCYLKKSSVNHSADLDRDHGWDALNRAGLFSVRMVSIDKNWSAVRFRNGRYIRSSSKHTEIK